jgi:hypothetical protein
MPAPNQRDRAGVPKAPPSVIAAPPVTTPVEPVLPVVAAEPTLAPVAKVAPVRETLPNVEHVGQVAPVMAAADLTAATKSLAVDIAEQIAPPPPPRAEPTGYVAVFPIITAEGRVEPGQPYEPTDDAERDLFLAQRVIRPA